MQQRAQEPMAPSEHPLRGRAKRDRRPPRGLATPGPRDARHRTAGRGRCLGAASLVVAATATAAAEPTVASSTTPPARPDTGTVAPDRNPPGRELTAIDV